MGAAGHPGVCQIIDCSAPPLSFPLLAKHNLLIAFSAVVITAGTVWAYAPGLGGGFVFDDIYNISHNRSLNVDTLDPVVLEQAAFSRGSGLSSRPLSMLSFAVNHYFSGFQPFAYKVTNLVIHLLNGLCLYVLTGCILTALGAYQRQPLTKAQVQTVGLVVTAAWLLHPINLTNVLYAVQRMNSLATLFTLLGLIFYMKGRMRPAHGYGGMVMILAAFLVFTPLALLCKENGALLPLYAFVLEFTLLRFRSDIPRGRVLPGVLFIVFLLVPLVGVLASLLFDPGWLLGGYLNRPFTLTQRLLTEARVLWFYLFITFVPDIRYMGLYHDDFAVSHGLTDPLSTLPAVFGIAGLLAVAAVCYKRAPLVTLGILFYVAGHSMESTIIPLELVFEHRNYLPVYGVLLPLFYYLAHPVRRWNRFGLRHLAAALSVAALSFATTVRAVEWANPLSFNRAEVAHHPRSARANYELGRVYYTYVKDGAPHKERHFETARRYFARSALVDRHSTNGLFGIVVLYAMMQRPPPGIVDMLAYRLAHGPFSNNNGNMLAQLVSCQDEKVCRLDRAALGRIIQAALRNKTLAGINKASVLTSASRYFAVYNDYPEALRFARQAIQAVPGELQYRLNVVYWLITMGRLAEARQALDRLRAMDTFNRHARYIQEQEQRLRDAQLIENITGDQ